MKRLIKKEIFSKDFKGNFADVRISDLPIGIEENDIIEIHREDSYFSENHSYDAYTTLVIIREMEETDDEYAKRIAEAAELKEELKARRYQHYLQLKKEFEV